MTLLSSIQNEPIAFASMCIIFGYAILRMTGLWKWLPNKLYGDKRLK